MAVSFATLGSFLRWPPRRRWELILLLLFAVPSVRGQEGRDLEAEVKAAFLVKFAMFVEWPTNAPRSEPFVIGVLGADPFGARFDAAVRKERIQGRPIVIRRATTAQELDGCQMVFLATNEESRAAEWLGEFRGTPVLTVADQPGFAAAGGMIGFYKESGKVRFEINPAAIERAGLKVSSKLIQVGRRVDEKEGAEVK
jgi:hypothetical protein